ncbi:hypothetical protein GCM10028781_01390 [Nostocoides australiense]
MLCAELVAPPELLSALVAADALEVDDPEAIGSDEDPQAARVRAEAVVTVKISAGRRIGKLL